MSDFAFKTYKDSYLYNKNDGGENLMKKHDKTLIAFINNAERIDKTSEQFSGVMEDVKRQQTSSILYTILMMPNVHLCINSIELPPAFKVFDAYDIRNDRRPAIFIDVTKLIVIKNGYYVCKNIGKLISYIFAAMVYLIYRNDRVKMLSNAAISTNGVECYVAMFNYILDYLRIIGYSANKDKISYFIALFFLVNMMDKDLDTYTKNLAAKTAGIPISNINAYDFYMTDGIFDNIDVFVTTLAETFKLKGFTTEVFVQKWIYSFGNGSQYGCELFSSFSVLMCYAFTGAYIINQKQIEKCCSTYMVKYCNALMALGLDLYNDGKGMMDESKIIRDVGSLQLAESFKLRHKDISDITIVNEDFKSLDTIKDKLDKNISYYKNSRQSDKISNILEIALSKGINIMNESIDAGENTVDDGVIKEITKSGIKYFTPKNVRDINRVLESTIGKYNDFIDKNREDEKSNMYAKALVELREARNIL